MEPRNIDKATEAKSESPQQLLVRQENVVVSRGTKQLPLEFVRSLGNPKENLPLSGGLNSEWWWSRIESLLGSQNVTLAWPFRACIEQQSAADLPHVRLVVVMIQGRYSFSRIS